MKILFENNSKIFEYRDWKNSVVIISEDSIVIRDIYGWCVIESNTIRSFRQGSFYYNTISDDNLSLLRNNVEVV